MRQRDLDALEFGRVTERLADFALSDPGREACRGLRPSADEAWVEAELERAWQCFRLLERHGEPPLAAFPEIRAHLKSAAHPGFILEGKALVEVRTVLEGARAAARFLRRHAEGTPALGGLRGRLVEVAEVEEALARALDEEGVVVDRASDELFRVRHEIRTLRERVTRRLEELLRRPTMSDVIGDDYVTIRNGRFVIPVRTSAGSRVAGVVQDRSVSGETLFVEPMFAVDLNNQLLMASREEEAIIRRILADLTDLVRIHEPAIETAFGALVETDRLLAGARFSRRYRCTQPGIRRAEIVIRDARHPGLLFTGRRVVPVDLQLAGHKRTLVITGPNTGGKTVALKTLGLCALMAQSGLLIPAAEGACLPCFRNVFADVGDEQNIERDLSTFSGHVANLREITELGPEDALVLLDEPGVGTDPEEGAALAIGLIRHLESLGARVAITTHYAPVKAFTVGREECEVAAVDFDLDTLTPRYRLVYHSLGRSLALPIAERLGLPAGILEAARAAQSATTRTWQDALDELERTRHDLERQLDEARAKAQALETQEAESRATLERLRERRRSAWQDELRAARAFVRQIKAEGRDVLRQVKESGDREGLQEFVQRRGGHIREREVALEAPARTRPAEQGMPAVGATVEVGDRGIRGELAAVEGDRAWILRGSMRFEVPAREVHAAGRPPREAVRVALPERGEEVGSTEVNLIGMRAREALRELEGFLDRAIRVGVPEVRIIHGFGSGALRRAVRDFLSRSPYCADFRPGGEGEGGDGATVATLRD